MGFMVVKQPDDLLAVWSTETDDWALLDAEPADVFDFFVDLAVRDARERVQRLLDAVLTGEPRRVYHQFARTFEELEATRRRVHDRKAQRCE